MIVSYCPTFNYKTKKLLTEPSELFTIRLRLLKLWSENKKLDLVFISHNAAYLGCSDLDQFKSLYLQEIHSAIPSNRQVIDNRFQKFLLVV